MINKLKYLKYNTNIQLVLLTTLLSNIGIFMVIPFLAIYLNNISSITTTDVGIIIGIAFWCQKAGSLLGGVLSDYFHIKKTMLIGLIIRIPGYLMLGFTTDFYILVISCSLIGLGSSIYLPAAKSFLVQNVEENKKVDVLSIRSVFSNIGVAIGPVIGLIIFKLSPSILFSSVAIIFFILLILNFKLKDINQGNDRTIIKFSDFNKLIKNKFMLTISFFTFLFVAFYIQLEVTMPMFASNNFGNGITSWLFVCNAFVVIFFQMLVSKWSCKYDKIPITIAFLFFTVSFLLLNNINLIKNSYITPYIILFLAVIFFSFAEIIVQIRLDFDATNVDPIMIATSFGIMSLVGAFGGLCGSYIGSILYSSSSISIWNFLAIASMLSAIIYFTISIYLPRVKHE